MSASRRWRIARPFAATRRRKANTFVRLAVAVSTGTPRSIWTRNHRARATNYDGSYHDVDSNEMAFKIAGSMAFKEAARKASPVLLEPVMAVEVVTPEDYAGAIMGDLSSRRGRIEGMEHRAGSQVIKAIVPLAEMFGYATHMRSNTQGRAEYSMHFARYEEVPRSTADEIIGRAQGNK